MSEQAVATVEAPAPPEHEEKRKPKKPKPKKQPPYAVVVFNDDLHTFEYVIDTFCKVFHYPREKSLLLAQQIHRDGRGIVWSGTRELAELKRDQVRSCGPDFFAAKKVEFPLGVTVEPLPG